MSFEDQKCPSCGAFFAIDDLFCKECGYSKSDSDDDDVVIPEFQVEEVRKNSRWILAISILTLIGGTIVGFMTKSDVDQAKANIAMAQLADDAPFPQLIEGKQYSVGELKAEMDKEVRFIFITNYFISAVMFLLFLWSKKNPFGAMATALAIYVTIMLVNFAVDPKTLTQGIVIKIIIIAALVKGLRSSLALKGLKLT